jgi:hypothetical protein
MANRFKQNYNSPETIDPIIMKKSLFFYVYILMFLFLFYGCKKECDESRDDLYEKSCTCDEYGTVGKFIGNYSGIVKEYNNGIYQYDFNFECTITKNSESPYTIDIFSNWNVFGKTEKITVAVSKNRFEFNVINISGYSIKGSGFVNADVMQINYQWEEFRLTSYYDNVAVISKR